MLAASYICVMHHDFSSTACMWPGLSQAGKHSGRLLPLSEPPVKEYNTFFRFCLSFAADGAKEARQQQGAAGWPGSGATPGSKRAASRTRLSSAGQTDGSGLAPGQVHVAGVAPRGGSDDLAAEVAAELASASFARLELAEAQPAGTLLHTEHLKVRLAHS